MREQFTMNPASRRRWSHERRRQELDRLLASEAQAGGAEGTRRVLVDRICRLWLTLGSPEPIVADRLEPWRRRFPDVGSTWCASISSLLQAGRTYEAERLFGSWGAGEMTVFGDGRWWAQRLLEHAADGNLAPPPARDAPGPQRTPAEPWVRDLLGSLVAVAEASTADVIVVHTDGCRRAMARTISEAVRHLGLRVLPCVLDDPAASHPLAGWVGSLWSDVHWRFLGDPALARIAPVVDHHLGWDAPTRRPRGSPPTVDGRRTDAVLVEIVHRLVVASPDELVVVVTGGPAALGWFDRFAHLVRHRRPPTARVRVVDVHLDHHEAQ